MVTCVKCPAAEVCPICRLVATVEFDSDRGIEIPRPFVLKPVTGGKTRFEAGEPFSFGLTLFGKSLHLFPYAILAVQRMGETGMGIREVAPGRFSIKEISCENPFTGKAGLIYSGTDRMVKVPDVLITHRNVTDFAGRLNGDKVTLHFITPLRLIVNGSLVKKLTFRAFMQRILRRLTDLHNAWCVDSPQTSQPDARDLSEPETCDGASINPLGLDFPALLKQAEQVEVQHDETVWLDLSSYSSRRQASSPIGGLTGDITFVGPLENFLPFLLWGKITHAGKDTTKGNGWYEINNI
jgi:hypothetical protein